MLGRSTAGLEQLAWPHLSPVPASHTGDEVMLLHVGAAGKNMSPRVGDERGQLGRHPGAHPLGSGGASAVVLPAGGNRIS